MRGSFSRHRGVVTLVLAIGAIATGAVAPSVAIGSVSPLTDPAKIEKLAKDAYIWGVAPEFVYRFAKYNELVTAPRQHVRWRGSGGGVEQPGHECRRRVGAVPQRDAGPQREKGRGGTKELVLTVPPRRRNYYVVVLLDAFINDVGSIGTRTTPSRRRKPTSS